MSLSDDQIAHALELFEDLGEISTRKMMGGLCLYHCGTIFAIIHPDGGLMIKGQGAFQAELDAMGLKRWSYARNNGPRAGKQTFMPYWSMPETALDDPEAACDLARRALNYL